LPTLFCLNADQPQVSFFFVVGLGPSLVGGTDERYAMLFLFFRVSAAYPA
jgi:hypothetical protein